MQQIILDNIIRLNEVETEEKQKHFLASLIPHAEDLWDSYRNPLVKVDYRQKEIQSVYMIRYFPAYSRILRHLLNTHYLVRFMYSLPLNGTTITANFIGCGPSPEIYGFFDFLNGTDFRPNEIKINTFDINSETWSYSRDITFNALIPTVWNACPVQTFDYNIDISLKEAFQPHKNKFENANLVVFQNCLNEISQKSHTDFIENFRSILNVLPDKAVVIIIDISGYGHVLELLRLIETDVNINAAFHTRATSQQRHTYDAKYLADVTPPLVRENLLIGVHFKSNEHLLPKRYVDYHALVLQKSLEKLAQFEP